MPPPPPAILTPFDPDFLARLRAENAATAARIAEMTRARAVKAAEVKAAVEAAEAQRKRGGV